MIALLNKFLVFALLIFSCQTMFAAETTNLLKLDASVSTSITPDTAVMIFVAERTGLDTGALSHQVSTLMTQSIAEAKKSNGIEASTGNFSSTRQYDNKGSPIGWLVRAELILKSKDFSQLGKVSGSLSQVLKITQSTFQVSPQLRTSIDEDLLKHGLKAFQEKAKAATQALGFNSYHINEITIHQSQLDSPGQPRPAMMVSRSLSMSDSAPVQIEAAGINSTLTVSGSVRMH